MALSLEFVDQYFTTWLDFLRLKPYAFFAALKREPTKYLNPFRFIAGSVTILCAIWAVTFGFLGHLPADAQKLYPQLSQSFDPTVRIPRQGFFVIFVMALTVLQLRINLWWPLRWKGTIIDVLKAQAYALSLSIVVASVEAALMPVVIWIGLQTNLPIAIGILEASILLVMIPVYVYYNLLSWSACTRLCRRRFFEAGAVIGVAVAGFLGLVVWPLVVGWILWDEGRPALNDLGSWSFIVAPQLVYGCAAWLSLRWGRNLAKRSLADPPIIDMRMS